jgi:GTP cyclohydrolase II
MGAAGGGILLYLRQEGRGIGIANKIRAYALQDRGLDTVDANRRLGFQDDERAYGHAAAMLRTLGADRVRLLTNNPGKVAALAAAGIEVVERVAHHMPANPHNADYLATKRTKSGHLA